MQFDVGIDLSVQLGKKTEQSGKQFLSKFQKNSKNLLEKSHQAGYQLKKQGKNLSNEISLKKENCSADDLEVLKRLFELKENGLITKKEFLEKKKKILSKI